MGHTKRILASTMAMATLAALACAPAANAATPLSLVVNLCHICCRFLSCKFLHCQTRFTEKVSKFAV